MTDPVTAGALASGAVLATVTDLMSKASTAKERLTPGSLTSIASVARVEPLTVIDNDCINLPYITDVMQSLQSIFSGYYLQAISVICDVGNVNVIRLLDKLNPNRKADMGPFIGSVLTDTLIPNKENYQLAEESYRWRLPTMSNKIALEYETERNEDTLMTGRDTNKHIAELTNLSVGKLIEVTIRSQNQEMRLPISIRLIANDLDRKSIINLLSAGSISTSFVERFYKWRAGRIEFFRDLILCQDLIKEHKKILMKDKDGVYSEIIRRANNNKLAALMSKSPSMAAASNLYVISEQTAAELHALHGINIENFASRQAMFEKIFGMIIVVIDREYQRINFYHRDMRLPSSVGIADMKAANKGSGLDINDILSAYKKGETPIF